MASSFHAAAIPRKYQLWPHWFSFPCEFDVFHTPNHWANGDTCIRFTENILKPYITRIREEMDSPDQPALLIISEARWMVRSRKIFKTTKSWLLLYLQVQPTSCSHLTLVLIRLQRDETPSGKNVQVNMCTTVMKELSAQWLTALYDNFRGHPELIK